MRYAITGAAGNISKPLVKRLLDAGHAVKVIGRNAGHLQDLVRAGARAAIGSLEDVHFLRNAFGGADAVFTMYPANFAANSLKEFTEQIGKNYVESIHANAIKFIVNLSSVGAHLPDRVGPVSGLHRAENMLNNLPGVNVLHLRPTYFYSNLLNYVDMIKSAGLLGSNFSIPTKRFAVADPADIAAVAASALLDLNFKGHPVRYIASDETSTDEIAAILGRSIGEPGLKWVRFSDEDMLNGLQRDGMPFNIAREYVEMFHALDNGTMLEDYWKNRPVLATTKLEDYSRQFAMKYNAGKVVA